MPTPTPTQQLQKIRLMCDVDKWMAKVTNLIALGADPRVLDNYKGQGKSIIKCYILHLHKAPELVRVVKFLLGMGVTPSNEVFVSCFSLVSYYSCELAELVMEASGNTIDVNELDFDGVPTNIYVMRLAINHHYDDDAIKYLISKGLRTNTNSISIDDIIGACKWKASH